MSDISRIFDGKNIVPRLPDDLARLVSFLTAKEREGVFVYSGSVTDWEEVCNLIDEPLGLGFYSHTLARAVGLAYIVSQTGGKISFPDGYNVWSWASALAIVAPVSGWDASCLVRVVSSFPISRDGIEDLLGNAVRLYCRAYFEKGVLLLSRLSSYSNYINAGLMEGDYNQFCTSFPPKDNQLLFTEAFIHAVQLPDDCVCKAFDTSKDFVGFESDYAMSFLLKSLDGLDSLRKDECKQRILNLLKRHTNLYVHPLCNCSHRSLENGEFFENCIIQLINGLDKKDAEASLKTIDHAIAFRDKNKEFLMRVVYCVAECLSPLAILSLEYSLHNLYEDKESFLELVLSFVLHPKGVYRMAGRALWDTYHLESSDFNPEELPEDTQCIFILFMLQDFGNPETRLPKIMPLFKSKSKTVLQMLALQLKPYTDEYMGHVTEAIDKAGIDTDLTRALKKYVDDRHISLEKRRSIKELSPNYAQYKTYQEAVRSQNVRIKQEMAKYEAEHSSDSIMNMFKRQVLARGGGWRKKDGATQHLIPITASFPARIMGQSMTPLERIKWQDELMKDYDVTSGNS